MSIKKIGTNFHITQIPRNSKQQLPFALVIDYIIDFGWRLKPMTIYRYNAEEILLTLNK